MMGELKQYLNQETAKLGIPATIIDTDKLVISKIPAQIRDEIPTLNRMGYMKIELDEYTKDFIQYAAKASCPVLEIGCAYGFIVQKVLEAGGRIIASDLSEEHLTVLLKETPIEYLKNLSLYPGQFPDDIYFPESSLSAVLASRILHFIDGDSIEIGLDKIHNWLKLGGKFYFVSVSPYHDSIRNGFLSNYEQNVARGVKWPGVIENQWEINPAHKDYVEPYLHVFDIPQLESLLPKHGFEIEKIGYFNYLDDTTGGDKGHIGFIATKR
jgi:SAM-dependent methyltransferase